MTMLMQSLLALVMAPNVDATMSFLPRRYNNVRAPFSITQPAPFNTRCVFNNIRGGHSDGINNLDGYAKEESKSQDTSSKEEELEDNNDSSSASHKEEGAWEEEIRKTREYYNTPRLSSPTNKILIADRITASENVAEDERVFGNAQTTPYNNMQGEEENHTESLQQLEEEAETDDVDSKDVDIEESKVTNEQSSEAILVSDDLSEEVDDTTPSSQDATDEPIDASGDAQDEEISIQQSSKISSQDESTMPLDNDDTAEDIEIIAGGEGNGDGEEEPLDKGVENVRSTAETNDVVGEGVEVVSSNTIDVEVKDAVANESEEPTASQDESVDGNEATDNVNELDDLVANESEEPTAAQDESVDKSEATDKIDELEDRVANESEEPTAAQDESVDKSEATDKIDELEDRVANESEEPTAAQDESVDRSETDKVELEGAAVNESGGRSVLAENEETSLEDYLDNSYGREVSLSNIDVKEEDLLLPHRWEKATTATASNKLVEDGLRRLRRRDGDEPSVPYVITRAMQRVLVEKLGYDPTEVKVMRPDVAVVIVAESLVRPELESLPSRFCNDIEEPPMAIEEITDDTSFKGTVAALFHRIQNIIVSRKPEATAIILASLGVALSLLFSPSSNDNKKSYDGATPTFSALSSSAEFQSLMSSDETDIEEDLDESEGTPSAPELLPDDLDKTWLDRLLSFVSKPFGA